jgi:hypothetical protein
MHEIKNDQNGIQYLVVEGVPVPTPEAGMPTSAGGYGAPAYGVRVGAPTVDQMER